MSVTSFSLSQFTCQLLLLDLVLLLYEDVRVGGKILSFNCTLITVSCELSLTLLLLCYEVKSETSEISVKCFCCHLILKKKSDEVEVH